MADVFITGVDEVAQKVSVVLPTVPLKVQRALYEESQRVMRVAKQRTPVETGALKASGLVGAPVVNGNEVTCTLAFGGPAAPYAIYVHEILKNKHPVGQAKFLESAVMDAIPTLASRVAARIKMNG